MSEMFVRPHFDKNGQDLAIEHIQDVEPILDQNALDRTEDQRSDWGRLVARIPNVLYVKWLNEAHAAGHTNLMPFTPEFDEIVQRKLQDPEYAYLRTDKPSLQVGWSWG